MYNDNHISNLNKEILTTLYLSYISYIFSALKYFWVAISKIFIQTQSIT